MPTIDQLNQRHPSVDVEETADLHALYHGGKPFKARLKKFLPQRPVEEDGRYQLRQNEAHYRNYLGPVVDYFASLLFANGLTAKPDGGAEPDEFYARFREDCDGCGADLDSVAKEALTEAMVKRCSWLRIEHPGDDGIPAASAKEYADRKLGDCWLTRIPVEQIYDWDVDAKGQLLWVITHSVTALRAGLSGDRSSITETWEYITAAEVETYAITYPAKKKPKGDQQVPRVSVKPHRFGAVPFVRLELKPALWVANRLSTPQLAHFRLSNAQTWGMAASCFAQPYFKVTRDGDGKPLMPVMGAGYGVVVGTGEEAGWMAPPAAPFESLGNEIKAQKDEIYRIAHQMALGVENNAAAVGRSADSKAKDAEATRVVLVAFSKVVREAIEKVYDLIADSRGEKGDWSISGLDDYAAVDTLELVTVLQGVDKAGGVQSDTFHIEMQSRIADGLLPDLDQSKKDTIRKEIEEAVRNPPETEPVDALDAMHEAALAAADGTPRRRGSRRAGKAKPKDAASGGADGSRSADEAA